MVGDVASGVDASVNVAGAAPFSLSDERARLFIALVVLNVLDIITTVLVLDRGGVERNPFVEPIVHDIMAVSVLKAVVLGIVGFLLVRCRPSWRVDVALTAATGWYLAVVMWNTAVLIAL